MNAKRLILSGMLMFVFVVGVSAQEATTNSEGNNDIAISETGLVSIDFRDADIRNVFKILALKSGVNIVASPQVTGTVTIQLTDVPWKQALDVILQTYGYAYDHKGNIILVTTVEDLKVQRENTMALAEQEPLITETISLNFAKAVNILPSLQKMKSDRGSVDVDDRTNMVILTDTPKKIELMQGVVKKLDTTTPQILIEAKIVETTLRDDENLGVDWTTMASVSGSSITHTWPFTTPVSGNKYLANDLHNSDLIDGNLDFAASKITSGTLNFNQMSAILEMLKTRTDTNILSNPRIVTLDNEEASIDVGTEYPYPLKFFNDETGTWQLSGWDYRKIGIILRVTPSVSKEAGMITLDLHPEVTENIGDVTDTESGSTVPELSSEKASTKVMVKDGETLVIAGLVKDKIIDIEKKFPLLGDIPILKYLFRKTSKTVTKTDLLIFVTPSIITPELVMNEK